MNIDTDSIALRPLVMYWLSFYYVINREHIPLGYLI